MCSCIFDPATSCRADSSQVLADISATAASLRALLSTRDTIVVSTRALVEVATAAAAVAARAEAAAAASLAA